MGFQIFALLPLLSMMILNLVFFVLVLASVLKKRKLDPVEASSSGCFSPSKKNTKSVRASGTRVSTSMDVLRLFVKFQILMGLNWVAWIVSGLFHSPTASSIFFVTNIVQGILISIVFLSSNGVWRTAQNRLHTNRSLRELNLLKSQPMETDL